MQRTFLWPKSARGKGRVCSAHLTSRGARRQASAAPDSLDPPSVSNLEATLMSTSSTEKKQTVSVSRLNGHQISMSQELGTQWVFKMCLDENWMTTWSGVTETKYGGT